MSRIELSVNSQSKTKHIMIHFIKQQIEDFIQFANEYFESTRICYAIARYFYKRKHNFVSHQSIHNFKLPVIFLLLSLLTKRLTILLY